MSKALLLRGLPASGKSTFAKEFLIKNPEWVRINRDDIRIKLYGEDYKHNSKGERIVLAERDNQIKEAISKNINFILDETFLNRKTRATIENMLKDTVEYEYVDFLDVTVEECIRRDRLRTGFSHVGEAVIRRMWKNWKSDKAIEQQCSVKPFDPNLPYAIICDIDSTLSLLSNRGPFEMDKAITDKVNTPVNMLLQAFRTSIYNNVLIFLVTGREDRFKEITINWLRNNSIYYDKLFMRVTGDKRQDTIAKSEIYEQMFKDKYNILFVLDDRSRCIKAYRELGLTAFQVTNGDY